MASGNREALPPFAGWPPAALDWFSGLEADNSRAWFHANRRTYDDAVWGPMQSLLAELGDEFGPGSISRPNRDTRFRPGAPPYKLEVYGRVPVPGAVGSRYVQLRRDGLFVGGGLCSPPADQLARIRAAIEDDRLGPSLTAIVESLHNAGLELLTYGALRTAPRGHSRDHPRIDLLRLASLAVGRLHAPGAWLHTPESKDRVVEGWRSLTPLLEWLAAVA